MGDAKTYTCKACGFSFQAAESPQECLACRKEMEKDRNAFVQIILNIMRWI